MASKENDKQLSNYQIMLLAAKIPKETMKTIAGKDFMDLGREALESLEEDYGDDDDEEFNRTVIRRWANMSSTDSAKVKFSSFFGTIKRLGCIYIGAEVKAIGTERNNSYYFSRANQQKVGAKIYSLTQCSLTVNQCDWYILAGNDERINSHCLTR